MLVLESEKYDLNTLFSFETLKQILIKLAKSQNMLEREMKTIKQNLFNKDDKVIFNLKNEVVKTSNIEEKNKENNKEDKIDNNEEKDKIVKDNYLAINENEININNDNNLNENTNGLNFKENEKNDNVKEYMIENKYDKDKMFNNSFNNNNNLKYSPSENKNNINSNLIIEKQENNIYPKNYNNNNININTNEITNNNNQNSTISEKDKEKEQSISNIFIPQDFPKFINQQKELRGRINILENKLSSKEVSIHNLENKIKNNSLENEYKIKTLNEKIDSLIKDNRNLSEKIEKLEVKTSDMDVFSMFKDNGDGNIDMTKVLVKTLEEKVFKKFELFDEKYKKDASDNLKLKTTVENIIPKIDQANREIEKINENNKLLNNDINSYKKQNEEKINDNISEINQDINNKIKEIKIEIEKDIKNKILNLEKNINNLLSKSNENENNTLDFLKLSLGNSADSEKIEMLTKKINDLRTKMNDIENTLKLYINSKEIDSIKNEMKDLKLILDKKISKDDLKELYNFHLSTKDEITDLKDRESLMHDDLTKTVKDLQNLQQRVESINGNLSLIQNNPKNENMKIIDFSKYIDNKKFSETLKPLIKEFEKINNEIESLKKEITESINKNTSTIKSAINLIEDDTNNKLNDLKKSIQKKYLEKFEFHKTIKSIEIQLKSNTEDKKKVDSESWLLAKKPLNCFNCASCESKIKSDEYIPADYLAWKKYPRGEKIHRMGQGFSHMLQMMTSEFLKNIEKNELGNENESSSRNINNTNLSTSPSFQPNEKPIINSMFLNYKDKDRDDSIGYKKKTKFKLPKMNQSKNKIKLIDGDNLPISDDENNDIVISDNNHKETEVNKDKDITSPKILKIIKKTKANILDLSKNKGIFKNMTNTQGILTPREKNKEFE